MLHYQIASIILVFRGFLSTGIDQFHKLVEWDIYYTSIPHFTLSCNNAGLGFIYLTLSKPSTTFQLSLGSSIMTITAASKCAAGRHWPLQPFCEAGEHLPFLLKMVLRWATGCCSVQWKFKSLFLTEGNQKSFSVNLIGLWITLCTKKFPLFVLHQLRVHLGWPLEYWFCHFMLYNAYSNIVCNNKPDYSKIPLELRSALAARPVRAYFPTYMQPPFSGA